MSVSQLLVKTVSRFVLVFFLGFSVGLPAPLFTNYFQSVAVGAQNNVGLAFAVVVNSSWGNGYKLTLNVESDRAVSGWQTDFALPAGHTLRNIYGASASRRSGEFSIRGEALPANASRQIVLIVDGLANHQLISDFFAELFAPKSFLDTSADSPVLEQGEITFTQEITDTWFGGYRLVMRLEAVSDVRDWQLPVELPAGYEISEMYGFEASQLSQKIILYPTTWHQTLRAGEGFEAVFILRGSPAAEFLRPTTEAIVNPEEPEQTIQQTSSQTLELRQDIPEAWNTGYKLNLEIAARETVDDWKIALTVPAGLTISEAYGLQVSGQTGRVTLRGQSWNKNLAEGALAQGVLIVQGSPASLLLVEEILSDSVLPAPENEMERTPSVSLPQPEANPTLSPFPEQTTIEVGQVQVPATPVQSFAYGEVLQKSLLFYEVNRSGELAPNHPIEWRGDATVNDGQDVGRDLSESYYDAGDHIIFAQPLAFSMAFLAWGGTEYRQAYQDAGQFDELLETVRWGTDWLLRAHETDQAGNTERLWVQVGNGEDHRYWVPPERIDDYTARPAYSIDRNRPGTEVAAGTASALAASSLLFRGVDDAYADELLNNAVALYEFADTYRGVYSDSVPAVQNFYPSWSGYYDELALGGVWLYKVTGQREYLERAERVYRNNVGAGGDWTYAPDEHKYAALALLAQESQDRWFREQFANWMGLWVNGEQGVAYTPGGFAHRAYWSSAPLTLGTAFIARWYHDRVETNPAYADFAKSQLDYLLGDNPRAYSYVVGFGDNYPVRAHHRGSAYPQPPDDSLTPNTHILWGALVGGPVTSDDYAHYDVRSDYVSNEVGISYNAPLASIAAQQYAVYGGEPLNPEALNALSGVSSLDAANNREVATQDFEQDSDGDGLLDADELRIGTDLNLVDTDRDGVGDGVEVVNGTDPFVAEDVVNLTARWLGTTEATNLVVTCRAAYPNSKTVCDFEISLDTLLPPTLSLAIGSGVFTPGKCRVISQTGSGRQVRCEEVNTGSEPGAREITLSLPTAPKLATLDGFSLEVEFETLLTRGLANVVPTEISLASVDSNQTNPTEKVQTTSNPEEVVNSTPVSDTDRLEGSSSSELEDTSTPITADFASNSEQDTSVVLPAPASQTNQGEGPQGNSIARPASPDENDLDQTGGNSSSVLSAQTNDANEQTIPAGEAEVSAPSSAVRFRRGQHWFLRVFGVTIFVIFGVVGILWYVQNQKKK